MSGSHSKSTFRVSINVSLVPVPVLCTGRLFQPLGQTSCEGERLLLVAGHYGVPSFFFPPEAITTAASVPFFLGSGLGLALLHQAL